MAEFRALQSRGENPFQSAALRLSFGMEATPGAGPNLLQSGKKTLITNLA